MSTQRPIKKEQLYTADAFIRFCQVDEHNTRKLGNHIIAPFLDAGEKDELIVPLHLEEMSGKNEKGEMESKMVKFYSPFQIFLASILSENIVDDDGNLRDNDLDWISASGHRARYLKFGGGSIHIDTYKEKKHQPAPSNDRDNLGIIDDFHSFLRILHSLKEIRHSTDRDRDTDRYYQTLPTLQYDLEPLKDDDLLADYGLDVEKLKRVLYLLALHTSNIDPLEHWYYYTKRHPQWRRDELKGMASVAQDLYGLCDILIEVIEMKSGEKLPPLQEFIHPNFKPYHMKKNEYAGGTDLFALKDLFSNLKSWLQDPANQEILKEAAGLRDDSVDLDKVDKEMIRVEKELADFEKRYGDRRYPGSTIRYIHAETKLKLSDLDPRAKEYVQSTMKQRREQDLVRKSEDSDEDVLRTNDPEIINLWEQGKITEATEKYFALQEKYEISRAVEWSLDEIRRNLSGICSIISNGLHPLHYHIEDQKRAAEPEAIRTYQKNSDPKDPKARGLYIQFINTGLKEALKEYDDKLARVREVQDQMHDFMSLSRLAYCAECRKRPVMLHQQHNDSRISGEAICDECLSEASTPRHIKSGPWSCDQCGKKIYQFAHGNVLSDVLINSASATIRLEYGRMEIEVKCQDRKCGRKQWKAIDWGWLP